MLAHLKRRRLQEEGEGGASAHTHEQTFSELDLGLAATLLVPQPDLDQELGILVSQSCRM